MSRLIAGTAVLALAVGIGQTGASQAAGTAPQAPRHFFGVNPSDFKPPTDGGFQLMRAGKVGTFRFQIQWSHMPVDPTTHEYVWDKLDHLMTNLATAGIRPLPFVIGTPLPLLPEGNTNTNTPPLVSADAKAHWKAFLHQLADRYGKGGTFWAEHPELTPDPIVNWQIWNEQNRPAHYAPKPSPRSYAKLLKISHAGLTAGDPAAKVILGGMVAQWKGGNGIIGLKFLKRLYKVHKVKQSFDGVALHPYSRSVNGVGLQLRKAREVMAKKHDRKTGLWVTEIGWASSEGPSRLQAGVEGQRKRLKQAFRLFLEKRRAWKLKSVLWFSWRDDSSPQAGCAWCATSGLFRVDGTAKPSWPAFTRFTGGDPRPDCSDGNDNDGDLVADIDDPGCHTDGDASNLGSYDAGDRDETN